MGTTLNLSLTDELREFIDQTAETERCRQGRANSYAMSFAKRSSNKERPQPATRSSKVTKMRLPVVS